HGLTFVDQPDGSHIATFDLSSIIFGDNGRVVSREDQSGSLRLKGPPYERAMREGIVYGFNTPVKQSGSFQFRIALRDTATSRIGAAGQFVDVPNLADNRLALSGIVIRGAAFLRDRTNSLTPPPSASPSSNSSNEPTNATDNEINNGPGVRQFHQGSSLVFVYAVYNALADQATNQPQLTTVTRIFRDGKPIYTGAPTPLEMTGQKDPHRPTGGAQLSLGSELLAGEYVLQIIVEDHLAKEKTRTATRWIDFEVIK